MSINRHNYETYFLLYVDNELSADDKLMVDGFIQQNPDLAIELHMLQQTILPIENTGGFNKLALLKNEATAINSNNFEEQFLLYIDKALKPAAASQVETFVLQHPQHQALFTQLKQTVLPIEQVVCPNKEALLKEEKPARVFWMRFTTIAVAAIFVGVMVIGGILYISTNNTTVTNATVSNNIAKVKTIEPTIAISNNAVAETTIEKNNKKYIASVVTKNNTSAYNNIINNTKKVINDNNNIAQQPIKKEPVENNNTLPIKDYEALVSIDKNATDLVNTTTLNNTTIPVITTNNESENNQIQTTVYKELDTNNNDKALYVGGLEINKDKLRGFFRKATKIISGKAKAATTDANNAVATFALSNK